MVYTLFKYTLLWFWIFYIRRRSCCTVLQFMREIFVVGSMKPIKLHRRYNNGLYTTCSFRPNSGRGVSNRG